MGDNKGTPEEDKLEKLAKIRNMKIYYKKRSAEDIVRDILESKSPSSTLLVDCQAPADVLKKIKGFIIAPGPVFDDFFHFFSGRTYPRVNDWSKSEAVRVLWGLCPLLLMYLNRPGCFTDIVVMTHSNNSFPLRNLIEALHLWTGDAKTNISFQPVDISDHSDTWTFSAMEERRQPIPWTTSRDIIKLVEYGTSTGNNSEEGVQLINSLNAHLKSLKSAIQTTRDIRDLKWKMGSLEAVQATLLEEVREEKKNVDALAPVDVKCTVCQEVFPGEIFHCTNGHCVCSACCEQLRSCPECRVSYDVNGKDSGKIRSRPLERVLAASMKMDCPNGCGEKLFISQVVAHHKICVKGEYAEVKTKLCNLIEMKRTQIESLYEKFKTLNNEMLQHELRWNTTSPNLVAGVPVKLMEEMYTNKMELANLQATLVLESVMKTAPPRKQ